MDRPLAIQAFHFFTDLPYDVRFLIWHFTLRPRIVEILLDLRDVGEHGSRSYNFYSNSTLPATLLVCKESRNALVEHYPLSFGFIATARIRFNFQLDTIFLPEGARPFIPYFCRVLNSWERSQIRHFAFQHTLLYGYPTGLGNIEDYLIPLFKSLTGLQEFLVVTLLSSKKVNIRLNEGYNKDRGIEFVDALSEEENIVFSQPTLYKWERRTNATNLFQYQRAPIPPHRPVFGMGSDERRYLASHKARHQVEISATTTRPGNYISDELSRALETRLTLAEDTKTPGNLDEFD
ncbi:hypothetical protein BDZ45DRAFT_806108 [Acephala macrosclerotiorum]|nr:hypothetical protein BDZ45DRAFT_806108 [Acephala macrosclerotiorum]